jgi:hypothetical protein
MATKAKGRKPATKSNLNVMIRATTARYLRRDAKKFNKALENLTDFALNYFLCAIPEPQRLILMARIPNKKMGRKVHKA